MSDTEPLVHSLDERDRIVRVNDAWTRFALETDAPELAAEQAAPANLGSPDDPERDAAARVRLVEEGRGRRRVDGNRGRARAAPDIRSGATPGGDARVCGACQRAMEMIAAP